MPPPPLSLNWYFLVQCQQWKHQNNVWNLFKVNNKDTRTASVTSFLYLYCKLWTNFTYFPGVPIVIMNTYMSAGGEKYQLKGKWYKKTILLLIITYQSANFEGQGSWNENVSKSKIKYLKSENFTDWFYLKEMIFLWFVN